MSTLRRWLIMACLSLSGGAIFLLPFLYASFEEDIKGSLKEVKLTDMVVLSKDVFTMTEEEILKTTIVYTILGGKIIYSSETE